MKIQGMTQIEVDAYIAEHGRGAVIKGAELGGFSGLLVYKAADGEYWKVMIYGARADGKPLTDDDMAEARNNAKSYNERLESGY